MSNSQHSELPIELIEHILWFLSIKETFRAANFLRLSNIRDKCVPQLKFATLDHASRKGQIDLLQWWKESGLECKHSYLAMDWASENEQVAVLQWWKESGLCNNGKPITNKT